jgi:hypothetical protein
MRLDLTAAHRLRQIERAVLETDLRVIAPAGYADAASTDRKTQVQAVAIFVSDQCFGLRQGSVAA